MNLEHLNSYPAEKVRALFGLDCGGLERIARQVLPELLPGGRPRASGA